MLNLILPVPRLSGRFYLRLSNLLFQMIKLRRGKELSQGDAKTIAKFFDIHNPGFLLSPFKMLLTVL